MNPSHTNRLRPRGRVVSVSPTPSPLSSLTLNRQSGALPVSTSNEKTAHTVKNVSKNRPMENMATLEENRPITQSNKEISTLDKV